MATRTVYAFDLPYYPEHHDMDFGYAQAAFVAWIPTAYGDEIWDVLQGPQPPAVQGPAEALPF